MTDDEGGPDDTDDGWEVFTVFAGPCTCDHEPDQHGWGWCDQPDCECEAGWEE